VDNAIAVEAVDSVFVLTIDQIAGGL